VFCWKVEIEEANTLHDRRMKREMRCTVPTSLRATFLTKISALGRPLGRHMRSDTLRERLGATVQIYSRRLRNNL
jgi:hypothetical protein